MEHIITDQDYFEQGLFILRDNYLFKSSFRQTQTEGLILTQKGDQSLKAEILRLISDSNSVLKICSFIITDQDIFEALLQKAKEGITAIFILTQLDPSKLFSSSLMTEEELVEAPSRRHTDVIKTLYEKGVHVRAAEMAHAKFVISDRTTALLMSANLTTPSMTINTESGFILEGDEVKALDLLFDVIFQKGATYKKYLTAGNDKQYIVQTREVIKSEWLPDSRTSKLRFTYEGLTNNLYRSIVEIIASATNYLYLSSYSIVGLVRLPDFVVEMEMAIGRGVQIWVFCRGMNYRPDHLESCETLLKLGCRIFGDLDNHSKGIVSESMGLLFTANIDGNHGLVNGFEVGVLLSETQRSEFLLFHKHLIDSAVYEFLSGSVRKAFFDTYEFYIDTKNIDPYLLPGVITIKLAAKDLVALKMLQTHAFFLGLDDEKNYYLIADKKVFACVMADGVITLNEETKKRINMVKHLIKYQTLKIEIN